MSTRYFCTLITSTALVSLSLLSHSVSGYCEEPQPTTESVERPVSRLPETLVSSTRIETSIEDIGRSVDAREREEIDGQQATSVTDSLQTVAGVRIQNLGGPGAPGTTPIEIRGFRTSGTQLLLNGLRLNDPSSVSGVGESFFSYLTSYDLSAIEVVKGSTGTLYGSDGQAGAVNLITQTPEQGAWVSASFRGGSFRTYEENAQFNVGNDQAALYTSTSRIDSEGLRDDGNYENTTTLVSGVVHATSEIDVAPIFRMLSAQNDLDTGPALGSNGELIPNQATESNRTTNQQYLYGVVGNYHPTKDFSSKLSVYANDSDREYFFVFDGFASISQFQGNTFNVDWQNELDVPELASTFLAGVETEHQHYSTTGGGSDDAASQDRYAAFLKDRLAFFDKILQIDGGARITHVSSIDRTLPSFEVSSVVKIPQIETRLHSSLAQGFRAPSLFETNGKLVDFSTGALVTVGNKHLREESTLSFDVGVTQPIAGVADIDVTFFNLSSDDPVTFDFANNTHFNGEGGENQGIETSLQAQLSDRILWRGAYTYLSKADVAGERLQRRPYNVFATSLLGKYAGLTAFTELRYRSSADIAFFATSERFRESDYTVVDAALTYDIDETWQLFARGNNLFDERYTESGYQMPKISFLGGIRLKIEATECSS